jgi:hypothetical protein
MAYCRFSEDCDLYCYDDSSGGFTSHFWAGKQRKSVNDPDLKSFLARLNELRQAGCRFPEEVIAEVRAQIERYGPDATEIDD